MRTQTVILALAGAALVWFMYRQSTDSNPWSTGNNSGW